MYLLTIRVSIVRASMIKFSSLFSFGQSDKLSVDPLPARQIFNFAVGNNDIESFFAEDNFFWPQFRDKQELHLLSLLLKKLFLLRRNFFPALGQLFKLVCLLFSVVEKAKQASFGLKGKVSAYALELLPALFQVRQPLKLLH